MKHRRLAIAFSVLTLSLGAFAAPGVAGATASCPDGMALIPSVSGAPGK